MTATATLTLIGDEYFLPIDEALLQALECAEGETVDCAVKGDRLVVTRHREE